MLRPVHLLPTTSVLAIHTMSVEKLANQLDNMSTGDQSLPNQPKEAPKETAKEVILGPDGKPLSKGELKKRAKEAESECVG